MKNQAFIVLSWIVLFAAMPSSELAGQALTGSSLNVSGTANIDTLNSGSASINRLTSGTANFSSISVSGTTDILGNALYLGSWVSDPSHPGISIEYSDGEGGANASITEIATRGTAIWNWQRMNSSGSSVAVMQIDASNRLILTGTAAVNAPQLVLDPNGITINGGGLLTQNDADARYILSNVGLSASAGGVSVAGNFSVNSGTSSALYISSSNGRIGIGTSNPLGALHVAPGATTLLGLSSTTGVTAGSIVAKDQFYVQDTNGNVRFAVTGGVVRFVQGGGEVVVGSGVPWGSPRMGIGSLGATTVPLAISGVTGQTADLLRVDSYGGSGSKFVIKSDGKIGVGNTSPQATLDVSGNTKISGTLVVSGSGLSEGYGISYTEGTNGANSAVTQSANRASTTWSWQRLVSGTAATIMQLDSQSRLILTGTGTNQLVLDPNGGFSVGGSPLLTQSEADSRYVVNSGTGSATLANTTISGMATINGGLAISGTATMNGSSLLTQTAANALYLSASAGLSAANGKVGIGTTSPIGILHVVGDSSATKWLGLFAQAGITPENSSTASTVQNRMLSVQGDNGAFFMGRDVTNDIEFVMGVSSLHETFAGTMTNNNFSLRTNNLSRLTVNTNGNVGIGTTTPAATLDVNGSTKISGGLAISGSGSLTLPDGTVLTGSNTLKSVMNSGTAAYAMSSGTAAAMTGTITASQVTGLSPAATGGNLDYSKLTNAPNNVSTFANDAGYVTSSGSVALAQVSATAVALSGTIPASQVSGLSDVATGGNLDYSKLNNAPVAVLAESGTASNLILSGTTDIAGTARVRGGIVVTGTSVTVTSGTTTTTKIVASGNSQLALIPEQGDLSMGDFTNGSLPQ